MLQISLKAEDVFHIGSWPVTNALLLSTVVLIVLVACAYSLRRRLAMVPGTMQNIFEMVLDGALGLMDSVLGDRRTSEKYLPLVFTIFLFVLFSNWFGLIPGVGSLVVHQGADSVPLFRSPASDLNFTLALALDRGDAREYLGRRGNRHRRAVCRSSSISRARSIFLSAYLNLSQNLLKLSRSRSVFSAMCLRGRCFWPSWLFWFPISCPCRSCFSRSLWDSFRPSSSGCLRWFSLPWRSFPWSGARRSCGTCIKFI